MVELEDWKVLTELFPEGWEQLGRSSGAVRRLRGFDSVGAVLRSLLLHVGSGLSLRQTAAYAKSSDLASVSDVTILNRLRAAEGWLREMCAQLLGEQGVNVTLLMEGFRVRLVDSTIIREPGKTGSQWRIHYSFRLPKLECDEFVLTSTKGAGVGERLSRFHFQPGDLILADAGFCNPPGVTSIIEQRAEVCMRLNPASLPLYDMHGARLDLATVLAELEKAGEVAEWSVWVHAEKQSIRGRLCALRKSRQQILQAERRLQDKKRRGQSVGDLSQLCSQYVLVFTTLPQEQVGAEKILELYRLRWQIELNFKRLKSIAGLGHLPKHDDRSSRAWLYAKLFLALLTEKMMRLGRDFSPWGYFIPQTNNEKPMA